MSRFHKRKVIVQDTGERNYGTLGVAGEPAILDIE